MSRERVSESGARKLLAWILLRVVALVALFVLLAPSPFFHDVIFELVIRHWVIALMFIICLCSFIPYAYGQATFKKIALNGVVIFLSIALMALYEPIVLTYLSQRITPQTVQVAPDTTSIRYQPRQVAEHFGNNQLPNSSVILGDFDPYDDGNNIVWTAPRIPNGFVNSLTNSVNGVNIIGNGGAVTQVDEQFACGEGTAFTHDVMWQLHAANYFATMTDVYYLKVNNDFVMVVPYITYDFVFPVLVPKWGGVMVVDSNCHIEDLNVAAAKSDPRFTGKRLFPESLAKKIGESWEYRHGIINAWFTHQDQATLPTLSGSNQMPFLLSTADGPQWFLALEPSSTKSHAVSKIIYVDAHEGEDRVTVVDYTGNTLIGPVSAMDYITGAFPSYAWYTPGGESQSTSGNITAIEPRPIVRQGILYWLYSITTTEYASVSQSVLLSTADDHSVYACKNEAQLKDFALGKSNCTQVTGNANSIPTPSGSTPAANTSVDLSHMADSEIYDLLNRITDELARRHP